jgi:hypothetical protein
MEKIDISYRIKATTSDDISIDLYPLDEYLNKIFLKFILSQAFTRFVELSDKHDGTLTLVNYKPYAGFSFVNSIGYLPFMLEVSTSSNDYNREDSAYINVKYAGKTINLNLGKLNRVIEAYGFRVYKRTVYVNIIQGATVKDFAFDVVMLKYIREQIDTRFSDLKLVETKIKTLIQTLESAIPTLRKDFYIEYKIFDNPYSDHLVYPHIFFIPILEGIVNEISDFLLSLYQQNYGIVTKLPPEFTPNENVESPELQKFLDKLPLDLIAKAVIGTYGSAPAVLLSGGDYSQYLAGNERVVNLGKNVVIVFGNSQEQQTLAPEQQNVEQNKEEENRNNDLNNLEKIPTIAEGLGKEIQSIYESIIEDDSINIEEKVHRLKTLNEALDELGKTVLDALKSQTPLDANQIRKYAEDIAKNGGSSYINNFEYYIDYYENHLTASAKLKILVMLLHSIGNIMYDIGKTTKEYNSQQLMY